MKMVDVRQHSMPVAILDDLASRFVINAPDHEKKDLIRMCFQVKDGNSLLTKLRT